MKKENIKLVIVVLGIIALVGIGFAIYNCSFKEDKPEENNSITADEKKFKEEYESLNGEKNKNDVPYKVMDIAEDNNVVYITDEEAVDIIKEETAVIYMGFKGCPWCRNAIPVLFDAVENVGIDKVYYLDLTDVRSQITLDANDKVQITKGTDAYYELMELLDNYIEDYSLTTSKGKTVKTGEKRIYAPTVITVKDGVVVGFNEGTVEGHDKVDGVLPDLTKEQTDKLYLIFEAMLTKISSDNCNENC
ncbi:MAG: hypothetical protein ACI31M_02175 [Bacilli bacterium]